MPFLCFFASIFIGEGGLLKHIPGQRLSSEGQGMGDGQRGPASRSLGLRQLSTFRLASTDGC